MPLPLRASPRLHSPGLVLLVPVGASWQPAPETEVARMWGMGRKWAGPQGEQGPGSEEVVVRSSVANMRVQ